MAESGVVQLTSGLSPQVRGNLLPPRRRGADFGPIPAGAGEPAMISRCVRLSSAYPRRCGGTVWPPVETSQFTGLSPQVRGNRFTCPGSTGMSGPIPAGAGEPYLAPSIRCRRWAYPRRCGGTAVRLDDLIERTGLSPQVRGNHCLFPAERFLAGPIPAGAGEPPPNPSQNPAHAAYPRRCGGTRGVHRIDRIQRGLSPQVRGNPGFVIESERVARPIPAGAGEPLPDKVQTAVDRAYPRRCGGTVQMHVCLCYHAGLSPQVRGNRAIRPASLASPGPIPAGAGEPLPGISAYRIRRAYPRRCGGTS